DLLALLPILLSVCLGILAHLLDLSFGKSARSLDSNLLLLARGLVLRREVEDTVGIDIEGHLDLRDATRCRRNCVEMETPDRAVVRGQLAVALQHVNFDGRLVFGCRREDLALPARDGRIRWYLRDTATTE